MLRHHSEKVCSIVRNIPIFSQLSDEEFEQISQNINVKKFMRGQVVLAEQDTVHSMYVICSGKVKVTQNKPDGREQIIATHDKGDFFGEMSLLDGQTVQANVIAMTDTTVAFIDKNFFRELIATNQHILQQVISSLCWRLRDAWNMVKILSQTSVEQRLRLLLMCIAVHHSIVDSRGLLITLPLTHKDVAEHASLARETVSRGLGKLVESGEIEILEKHHFLLTKEFLKKNDFGDFNHTYKRGKSDIVTITKR